MDKPNQTSEKISYFISNKLRKIRFEKGYCQEHMAHQLNVSQSYYSRLERGKEDVTLKKLIRIADMFQINPREFFINTEGIENTYSQEEYIEFLKSSLTFLREEVSYLREVNLELLHTLKRNGLPESIRLHKA